MAENMYTQELLVLTQNDLLGKLGHFIAHNSGFDHTSGALIWASMHGKTEFVEILIPVSKVDAFNNQALNAAIEQGHADCVQLLFPLSDYNSYDTAVKTAVIFDQVDILKWIFDNNSMSNRTTTVALLSLSVTNPSRAIFNCLYEYGGRDTFEQFLDIRRSQWTSLPLADFSDYISIVETWACEEDGQKISVGLDCAARCTSSRKI